MITISPCVPLAIRKVVLPKSTAKSKLRNLKHNQSFEWVGKLTGEQDGLVIRPLFHLYIK